MAAVNPILWGIHSMDDFLLLNQNLIALGWEEMEHLSSLPQSRDAFKERYGNQLSGNLAAGKAGVRK